MGPGNYELKRHMTYLFDVGGSIMTSDIFEYKSENGKLELNPASIRFRKLSKNEGFRHEHIVYIISQDSSHS